MPYDLSTVFNTNRNDLDRMGRINLHLVIQDEASPDCQEIDVRISIKSQKGTIPPWTVINRIRNAMQKQGWEMEGLHLTGFHFSTKKAIKNSPWYERMGDSTRAAIKRGTDNVLVANFWDGRYYLLVVVTRPDRPE